MNWYKHGHRFTKDGGLTIYLDKEDIKNLILIKEFWDSDLPPFCSMTLSGVVQSLLRHQANYIKGEHEPSFKPSDYGIGGF